MTNVVHNPDMEAIVPTTPFSEAKSQLSELMTSVFYAHQPRLVSRHGGKEQMLLLRPEDLLEMLGDQRFDVVATYDGGEVTLAAPDLGVIGMGDTLAEAVTDLVVELRAYAERFFADPARYAATERRAHAGPLLRFALTAADQQAALLTAEPGSPALAPG
jgi:hypothetical protein